ncbi:MAG: monovalent cation/H+ antiporter complex subunit F [Alphaproteobacteria bacterium]|jgi:multicomponent Na+:H+ antiporter subunit F|nr:pH regulation protein F [Rhodospirillaceae bacterium]MBT6204550.1 pH regulation protein F [Rhodospirillaceae bacterium]MBT7614460.1 pH regulation protein F [Rhodospirillaceae bacterium]MBT7645637.1 pH regulation protein F [Rhodospirillaceae bacterium]MDG2481853.1 monovalent cation/H+ antiporter complex subunit F [Alphaproteobacteria bacterium]
MFDVATLLLVIAMALTLVRAVRGPTPYDRILAVNVHGTMTVLLIALAGFLTGRPDFLDLSLTYALLNFVGTLAALKFFKFGHLGEE